MCRIILQLSHSWSSPQKRHFSSYSLLCSQPLGLSLANTRGSLITHWINEIVSQLFLYYYLWYLQQTAGNQVSFSVRCTLPKVYPIPQGSSPQSPAILHNSYPGRFHGSPYSPLLVFGRKSLKRYVQYFLKDLLI